MNNISDLPPQKKGTRHVNVDETEKKTTLFFLMKGDLLISEKKIVDDLSEETCSFYGVKIVDFVVCFCLLFERGPPKMCKSTEYFDRRCVTDFRKY